jgi:hypothetical protein
VVDPIADIAAILAVVAGVVAAAFAWRGDRFSRQIHSRDIEPRVRLAHLSTYMAYLLWDGQALKLITISGGF